MGKTGSGEVQGVLATDKVQLPGGALAVDNLTFGITTSESVQFADPSVPFDGLMGLAIVCSEVYAQHLCISDVLSYTELFVK